MLRGIFRQSKVRGGGVSSPLACTQQELIWALVSLCALHRISFSAQLLTQEFPAEITPRGDAQKPATYDESVLIRAAQASGLRIKAISLKACKAPGLPLPLLVQLNAPQSIPPTSADATAANDESIESKPSSALLSSLVLVTTATAEQVVYFQLGNQQPITVAPSAFDALHTGCAWIVTPEPEAVRDEDGQAGDGIQVVGYLNTVAAEHHGDDCLDGGKGNDKVSGQGGADQLFGGDGNDYISSSAGIATDHQNITSTDTWNTYGLPAGKEVIVTQARWGVYKDGPGDDATTIWSGIGPTRTDTAATEGDVIDAGAGDDNVIGSWAADRIEGGLGDDEIDGLAGSDIIEGNEGDDELSGDGITKAGYLSSVDAANHGADFIDGGEGKDEIDGQGGADQLFGGNGDDKIFGDSGVKSDSPYAVALQYQGDDYIDGEGGNDYAEGNKGDDTIYGGATPIFVANYTGNMPAKCSKGLKNRRKTSKPSCAYRKYKPNQLVAHMDIARSATEFVVNS
jgi:hypothetical protein